MLHDNVRLVLDVRIRLGLEHSAKKTCQQMKRDLIYLIAPILSLPPCLHVRSPTGGEDENPC